MKIRIGFVSNSSTCSYLILGAQMDRLIAERLLALVGIEVPWGPEEDEDAAPWDEFDEPSEAVAELGLKIKDGIVGLDLGYVSDDYDVDKEISGLVALIAVAKEKLGVTDEQIVLYMYMSGG